ncbi:MAG: hypothetical protein Tsb002_22290 [Wenzhouxiangellaceae bacterium]
MRVLTVRSLLLVLLLTLSSTGFAAKMVQPPIQDLLKERYQISVLELQAIDRQAGKAEFEQVTDLWQETDDEITLNLPPYLLEEITAGERYIVAHSRFRKHPILRDVIQLNPDGPAVVEAFVVRHGLFDDSRELRYLFREFQDEEPNARKIVARLLDLLEESDGRTRTLAAFQFQMSQPLYDDGLRSRQLRQLQEIIASNRLSAEEEEFLLSASPHFPATLETDWIADHCRQRMRQHGSEYELTSFIPLLVKTCTGIVAASGGGDDVPLFSGLLYSNAPGVAKAAMQALIDVAPQQADDILNRALASGQPLHSESARVIRAYLAANAPE